MRILTVIPRLIVHTRLSADEQDRLYNITDLTELGHDVRLIVRPTENRTAEETVQDYARRNIQPHLLLAKYPKLTLRRFSNLAYLDGATWSMAAPDIKQAVQHEIQAFKPDALWLHATYSWPIATWVAKHGIPTVIRSTNYEAVHFWQSNRPSLQNRLKFTAKVLSEIQSVKKAAVLVAITPHEQTLYQGLNKRTCVELLPLRALPYVIAEQPVFKDHSPLHVYFMGASYNFPHNRLALEFLVNELIPRVRQTMPGQFVFHITGSKADRYVNTDPTDDLFFHQYLEDLDTFLAGMDIALAPSLAGTGMQQKVFEPICRGFPTLTHSRVLAGYDLENGKNILLADNIDGFLEQLTRLRNPHFRQQIAANALDYAKQHFAKDVVQAKVSAILEMALANRSSSYRRV